MIKPTPILYSADPIDLYPSRIGQAPGFFERQDPVVYAPSEPDGPLSKKQLRQYAQQGYLVLDHLFSSAEISAFQRERDSLQSNPDIKNSGEIISERDSDDIRSIFRVHEVSALFKKLGNDQRLAGIAEQILNDEVYIHQSRLNYKPGLRGKEFYWHSDFETWHVEDGMPRMRALSMSITLTENTEQNGPLLVIPGSHQQFLSCQGKTPHRHFEASLKKQEYGIPDDESLETMAAEGGIASVAGQPGSVIIFDCNLMHGSNGNITPHPRSNVFYVYNAVSNRVIEPFCNQPPRPEYICSRKSITPIQHIAQDLSDE